MTSLSAADYIGRIVEILPGVLEHEVDYIEPGMLARIKSIEQKHDYTVVTMDTTEFEERNRPLETFNYYDKNGDPTLSAREAGKFNLIDKQYFPNVDQYPEIFTIHSSGREHQKLAQAFAQREDKTQTYLDWCEKELIRLWDRR